MNPSSEIVFVVLERTRRLIISKFTGHKLEISFFGIIIEQLNILTSKSE